LRDGDWRTTKGFTASALGTPTRSTYAAALCELVGSDDPQLRPALLRRQDRCLPFAGQVIEAVGVEQRLMELAPLIGAQLGQRRVGDDLLDASGG
jgi:hypothetical protein